VSRTGAALLLLLLAPGCAPRSAVSTWPYPSWYSRRGTGEGEPVFERARRACLEELGVEEDPSVLVPDSLEEKSFLLCMNDAGWCTSLFHCDKGSAR
jgi:hypothetical protein